MVSKKVTVTNPRGIHARTVAVLVKVASRCKSDIRILAKNKNVNLKDIMGVMGLAIVCGEEVEIQCSGESEAGDLEAVVKCIENIVE